MRLPAPLSTSQSSVRAAAALLDKPSRKAELTIAPSSSHACSSMLPPLSTSTMGRPNLRAKLQSRWSWPGTAMIAPVP
jgi:hypothetical protein